MALSGYLSRSLSMMQCPFGWEAKRLKSLCGLNTVPPRRHNQITPAPLIHQSSNFFKRQAWAKLSAGLHYGSAMGGSVKTYYEGELIREKYFFSTIALLNPETLPLFPLRPVWHNIVLQDAISLNVLCIHSRCLMDAYMSDIYWSHL